MITPDIPDIAEIAEDGDDRLEPREALSERGDGALMPGRIVRPPTPDVFFTLSLSNEIGLAKTFLDLQIRGLRSVEN